MDNIGKTMGYVMAFDSEDQDKKAELLNEEILLLGRGYKKEELEKEIEKVAAQLATDAGIVKFINFKTKHDSKVLEGLRKILKRNHS